MIFNKKLIKLKNFLLRIFSLLLLFTSSSVQAAEVTCQFTEDEPPLCPSFTITEVTSPNEKITILGQPSDYVDEETTNINFFSSFANQINYIPTNLFKFFPAMDRISFTSDTMFSATERLSLILVTDSFNYCEKLTNLQISMSNVSHIPERFASNCKFLATLMLNQNSIQTIDENAFEGLESLEYIYLMYNQITCLPPLLFRHNLALRFLDFSYNKITALHPTLFKDLTLLQQIMFPHNLISYIPNFDLAYTGTASPMSSDIYLYFSNNSIQAIDPEFLSTFFYSRQSFGMGMGGLSLNFMSMSMYDNTCVNSNGMPSMLTMPMFSMGWVNVDVDYRHTTTCYSNWNYEMANNDLVTCGTTNFQPPVLHDTFRCYSDQEKRVTCVIKDAEFVISRNFQFEDGYTNKDVTRLYFVDSQLREVPEIIFETFPNLSFLSIANTNLRIIDNKTFKKCGNLEFLDATNNDIIRVEETAFENCKNLKKIDLSGNQVDSISNKLYLLDPSLESVYLNRFDDFVLA